MRWLRRRPCPGCAAKDATITALRGMLRAGAWLTPPEKP